MSDDRDEFLSVWVERFRTTLMERHADDWDMETCSEAAHVCAEAMVAWFWGFREQVLVEDAMRQARSHLLTPK